MLKKFLKVAALSAILFSSAANAAEKLEGSNVTGGGAWGFASRDNDFFKPLNSGGSSKVKLDKGYNWFVGFYQANEGGMEGGIEASYRYNNQMPSGVNAFSLENKTWSLMAKGNYYLDMGIGGITPYVGVGVGAARVNMNFAGVDSGKPFTETDAIKKIKLAYSAEAGVAATVSQNMMVGAAVEYFGLWNIDKEDADTINAQTALTSNKIKVGDWNVKGFVKFFM